jgi:UDP-3-O-[3-hydroxymyristoyl] glucosamine N-acyltransferase
MIEDLYSIDDYLIATDSYIAEGNGDGLFKDVKPIFECSEKSLSWVNPTRKDKNDLFENTRAAVLICQSDELFIPKDGMLIIKVNNPKWFFASIVNSITKKSQSYGIHESSVIHPEAKIHKNVYIGPNCYIGACFIDEGSVIQGNCFINSSTEIGKNVTVAAGCIIGTDGFGYVKDEQGNLMKFPHIGGVLIEDDVEIGANTCIDRGSLGMTKIKKGAKIDNLVHIAHNVEIGERASIVALAMIGGSSIIGNDTWVAPSSAIRDAIQIGSNSLIGLGAVVTKSVGDSEVWAGNPAKRFDTK